LPLIIFWNAATGHKQVCADFALAIARLRQSAFHVCSG
jgi:hypothetical protein